MFVYIYYTYFNIPFLYVCILVSFCLLLRATCKQYGNIGNLINMSKLTLTGQTFTEH